MTYTPGRQEEARDDLTALLTEARSAAADARLAAEAATHARASLDEASAALREAAAAVEDASTTEEADKTIGRFLRITAFCAVCLIGAGIAMMFVPAAFGNPAAFATKTGSVQLAVATSDSATSWSTTGARTTFYIEGSYSQNDPRVSYRLWYPKEFGGRRFALLLLGSAVMTKVSATGTTVNADTTTCRRNSAGFDRTIAAEQPCQIVYGTVPAAPQPAVPDDCSLPPAEQTGFTSVVLDGQSSITTAPDWAHHVTNLPSFIDSQGPQTFTTWDAARLDGQYGTGHQAGCRQLERNPDWQLGDVDVTATSVSPDWLTWSGTTGLGGVALVSSNRNAQGHGNVLLAIAGAFAALAIGFIPVAHEEFRTWRRAWKQRRETG